MTNRTEPLVSVILRSMERSTLDDALDSVARQHYQNIEILVVNAKGGSHRDVTALAQGRPLHIINQGGDALHRSAAANAGLAAAKGEYFSFLDDDDLFDPEHFSCLVAAASMQAGDVVVYAGIRGVDAADPEKKMLRAFLDDYEPGKLIAGNHIPIHAPLVPSTLLAHGLRFDESLDLYEDWDFWLQVSRHARFVLLPRITGTYTINGASGMNPVVASPDAVYQATQRLYKKWLPLLQLEDLWAVTRLYHHRNHGLYLAMTEKQRLAELLRESDERHAQAKRELLAMGSARALADEASLRLGRELETARAEVEALYQSKSWRITAPLRAAVSFARKVNSGFREKTLGLIKNLGDWTKRYGDVARFALHAARHHGGVLRMSKKTLAIFRVEGMAGVLRRLPIHKKHVYKKPPFSNAAAQSPEWVSGDCKDLRIDGGVVVVAHVYYPELFEELVLGLANIPWAYTLCISVTNATAEAAVKLKAASLPHVRTLDVRVVPNRGRDIAPMLVEFRDQISLGKYMLHVHTKKSMYSGRERREWRRYLLDGLMGSERRIRHIFTILTRNPTVGIVYPDTFDGVPYWAHNWLKNRGPAHTLAHRLGVDIRHHNYVDAPMGSMFWARVDALAPLLNLKLDYRDFPPEQGQTDGTLQHAIERFFVLAANHAGFAQRVILDGEGDATLFRGSGRKNLHHYFAATPEERIIRAGSDAKIVSFDIFDTLLIRPWLTPDGLFAYLECWVEASHGLTQFTKIRKEAEQQARLSVASGDVSMDEIYDAVGKRLGDSMLAASLRLMEEALEKKVLRPRHDVLTAARQLKLQGKRLVLVSDMYLSQPFLKSILLDNHIHCFDELYVSSQVGLRKDRGDMWADLPGREGIAAEDWLHVGDNEHSDLQLPLEAGYRHPVHVMKAADQFLLFNEGAEAWIDPDRWQESLLLGLLANRLFVPGASDKPVSLDVDGRVAGINSLVDLGYLAFGPALVSFMSWLMQDARKEGVELLLYASREGHLLQQAHGLIGQHIALPDAEYFLCSRRAAVFSSIQDQSSLEPLLKAHFNGTFADFLRLRLGVDSLDVFAQRVGANQMNANCDLPERIHFCRSLLVNCLDILKEAADNERSAYQHYAHAMISDRRAAMVDIGYSGTIQKALAKFVKGIAGGYYFVTVEAAEEIERTGQFAKACFGQYINAFHSDIPVYQFALLSEAILTAPHGQLIRFAMKGDEPVPAFKAPGVAQAHFSDIEQIHEGALKFLSDVLDAVGENFEWLAGHNLTANLAIRQLMNGRWKLQVDSPALHVEDNYSGNQEVSVFDFYEKKRVRLPGTLDS